MTANTPQAVLSELANAREAIWSVMPDEVRRLGAGIQPRGTGSFGQYFTPIMFAEGLMRNAGDELLWNLREVAADEASDLATVKRFISLTMDKKAHFIDFIGMPETGALFLRVVAAIESTEDRTTIVKLLDAAMIYANRMHLWIDSVFPWAIANAFPQPDSNSIRQA